MSEPNPYVQKRSDDDLFISESLKWEINAICVSASQTPSSALADGKKGTICWDENYLYVCVAPNTWKRVALSTWLNYERDK